MVAVSNSHPSQVPNWLHSSFEIDPATCPAANRAIMLTLTACRRRSQPEGRHHPRGERKDSPVVGDVRSAPHPIDHGRVLGVEAPPPFEPLAAGEEPDLAGEDPASRSARLLPSATTLTRGSRSRWRTLADPSTVPMMRSRSSSTNHMGMASGAPLGVSMASTTTSLARQVLLDVGVGEGSIGHGDNVNARPGVKPRAILNGSPGPVGWEWRPVASTNRTADRAALDRGVVALGTRRIRRTLCRNHQGCDSRNHRERSHSDSLDSARRCEVGDGVEHQVAEDHPHRHGHPAVLAEPRHHVSP